MIAVVDSRDFANACDLIAKYRKEGEHAHVDGFLKAVIPRFGATTELEKYEVVKKLFASIGTISQENNGRAEVLLQLLKEGWPYNNPNDPDLPLNALYNLAKRSPYFSMIIKSGFKWNETKISRQALEMIANNKYASVSLLMSIATGIKHGVYGGDFDDALCADGFWRSPELVQYMTSLGIVASHGRVFIDRAPKRKRLTHSTDQ